MTLLEFKKYEWRSILRFKLKIDKTPGYGPWGDCHLFTGPLARQNKYGIAHAVTRDGKRIIIRAHKLIYVLTYGEIPPGKELSHKCHVRNCCNIQHIIAESHLKNIRRSIKAGRNAFGVTHGSKTHPEKWIKGEAHYLSKLKEKDIRFIRASKKIAIVYKKLAKKYNVSYRTIYDVINFRTWKHVT